MALLHLIASRDEVIANTKDSRSAECVSLKVSLDSLPISFVMLINSSILSNKIDCLVHLSDIVLFFESIVVDSLKILM